MDIRLDTRRIEPGGTLRGVIANAPADGIGLAVRALILTPFTERTIEATTYDFADGLFDLAGPTWPLSSSGPVISTSWSLDVLSPGGATVASVPFELVRGDPHGSGAISIEAVDNDDLFEPHRALPPRVAAVAGPTFALAALAAVAAVVAGSAALGIVLAVVSIAAAAALGLGYAFERRHVIEHDIHCRCLPGPAHIECTARLQHRDDDLPDVERVTATLLVVESAAWTRPHGGHAEREAIIFEHTIPLEPDDSRTWYGSIVELPAADTPLSWAERIELEQWAVTWAVRFVVAAADGSESVHVVHLRSSLSRLDAELGGDGIGDPPMLRSA